MIDIPGKDALAAILGAVGAPPYVVLDIGGSADLNGDGLVRVSLDADGALVFEDV
ncbi:hypothetical protein [uncultured Microbacterium sp.]|uniref:hypothetical protein n=1 Tax=uncultured Microbacterium sp. TaxID=191216 RepID=UPI0025FA587C|nr:hypothetical protein [uncultured Microbacterium sp.]